MIQLYKNTVAEFNELSDIVTEYNSPDFYITENNQRVSVNNSRSLKKLIKQSHIIYYVNDYEMGYKGLLVIYKSISNDVTRNYIKILTSDYETVRDLLTVLSWNYGEELYVKLQKNSPYLKAFYTKGFRFSGGRGEQILLKREKREISKFSIRKTSDESDFNTE